MNKAKNTELFSYLFLCFVLAVVADLFFLDYVHPFIVIGLGVVFIIWALIIIGMTTIGMRQTLNTRRGGFAIIFLSSMVILISILYSWYPSVYLTYAPVLKALGQVCSEKTFPENPIFQENSYNPLLGIDSSNTQGKWALYPIRLGWTPHDPSEVTLVGCFDEHDSLVETCHYTGATVERYQNRVYVTLIEVKTGTIVGQQVFDGTAPGECVSVVTSGGEIHGTKVGWDDMNQWINGFVNPSLK